MSGFLVPVFFLDLWTLDGVTHRLSQSPNYQSTLCNIPNKRRFLLHLQGRQKSRWFFLSELFLIREFGWFYDYPRYVAYGISRKNRYENEKQFRWTKNRRGFMHFSSIYGSVVASLYVYCTRNLFSCSAYEFNPS